MGLYKSVDRRFSGVHVKTNDEVIIVSGDDKGKRGKVIAVSPKEGKIIVDGVNVVSKHVKPRKQGQPGGIIKAPGAIYACKVMPYCSKCGTGVRVRHIKSGESRSVRVCAKCEEEL